MNTPTPRPHGPGTVAPGAHSPRPGAPLPGRHLPGAQGTQEQAHREPADPTRIRGEIDDLLTELDARSPRGNSADGAGFGPDGMGFGPADGMGFGPADGAESGADTTSGVDITRRARILEQAHDVLVQALATVDKI